MQIVIDQDEKREAEYLRTYLLYSTYGYRELYTLKQRIGTFKHSKKILHG